MIFGSVSMFPHHGLYPETPVAQSLAKKASPLGYYPHLPGRSIGLLHRTAHDRPRLRLKQPHGKVWVVEEMKRRHPSRVVVRRLDVFSRKLAVFLLPVRVLS